MNEFVFKQWFNDSYLRKQVMKHVHNINLSTITPFSKGLIRPLSQDHIYSFGIKDFGSAAGLCKLGCYRLVHHILMLPENVKLRLRREYGLHCDLFNFEAAESLLECCDDYKIYLDVYRMFPSLFKDFDKIAMDSAFEVASTVANYDILKHLLKLGSKPTMLSLSRVLAKPNVDIEFVKFIVNDTDLPKESNTEVINRAIRTRRLDIITFILDHINFPKDYFTTCLECAVESESVEIVEMVDRALERDVGADFRKNKDIIRTCTWSGAKDLNMLKWLLEKYKGSFETEKIRVLSACKSGSLELLEYILDHLAPRDKNGEITIDYYFINCILYATEKNYFPIVEYLILKCKVQPVQLDIETAASHGHCHILELIHANSNVNWTTKVMDVAVKNGHLEVIKFLDQNRTEGGSENIINLAVKNGRFDIVQFMVDRNRTEGFSGVAVNWAVAQERFDMLEYLTLNLSKYNIKKEKLLEAATNAGYVGRIDILTWLLDQGYKLSEKECMLAAITNGHSNIVHFLIDTMNVEITEEYIIRSIEENRAGILDYFVKDKQFNINLKDQKISWALDNAASKGHLESIRFINDMYESSINNGVEGTGTGGGEEVDGTNPSPTPPTCLWSSYAISRSLSNAHRSTLVYLLEKSDPSYLTVATLHASLINAIKHGHLHMVIFLHEYLLEHLPHIPLNHCFNLATFKRSTYHYHILKYVLDNRIFTPEEVIIYRPQDSYYHLKRYTKFDVERLLDEYCASSISSTTLRIPFISTFSFAQSSSSSSSSPLPASFSSSFSSSPSTTTTPSMFPSISNFIGNLFK